MLNEVIILKPDKASNFAGSEWRRNIKKREYYRYLGRKTVKKAVVFRMAELQGENATDEEKKEWNLLSKYLKENK